MAEEIRFPRLGWSMEEGRFVGWLKKHGDQVKEGDLLFEMEGEKALQEIESVGSGTLFIHADSPKSDSVVQVGVVLGYLLADGEVSPDARPLTPVGSMVTEPLLSGMDTSSVPTTPLMNQEHRDQSDTEVAPQRVVVTPRARRLAESLSIDWQGLVGTGRENRVREADVLAAAQKLGTISPVPENLHENRFTSRRKAIAGRLRRSRELTIPVTLNTTVDVTSLVLFREMQKKMQAAHVPGYADLFAKYVALVLARHPAMAVRWNDDHSELYSVPTSEFHIGLAVDTSEGLLVPVLRHVYDSPIEKIVEQSKELIGKARSGKLSMRDMSPGVISITNLGAWGIDAFTPIINIPEIAILGLGAIRKEPVVAADGQIVVRERMVLSLTFDHAAVDGAPAAAFLKDLVTDIESLKTV